MGQAEPTRCGRTLALVRGGLMGTVVVAAAITGGWLSQRAGAAGILPPNNPPANIAPSSPDFLTSIDTARADEGVGPMDVSESVVSNLPVDEQALIIVNEERINRGLAADRLRDRAVGRRRRNKGRTPATTPDFPPPSRVGAR